MFENRSLNVNVVELIASIQRFGIIDYAIFIAMLFLSSAIGLYFGIRDKRKYQRTNRRRESIENNYFVGGRKMKIFPIAMSLTASLISGVQLLGYATEVYVYGTSFTFLVIPFFLASIFIHYVFIPIYLDVKLTSSFEYLEARFDRKMRYLGSTSFLLTNTLIMPITLYASALAFNQVSGINIHIITTTTCLVCIFYTTLGGMEAVVWTDVLQTIIMYGSLLLIVILGTQKIGGFSKMWRLNFDGGRIEFPKFTLDLTERHSIISLLFGCTLLLCQVFGTSQIYVQRYVSLPSKQAAQKALWLFTLGFLTVYTFCTYSGLLIYATYHDCDPVTTKFAESKDQLLAVLVMNVLRGIPGVTGLFIAGIFSATLSTLSTTLNSFSAVILEDFIKPLRTKPISIFFTNVIMQGVVIISGLLCICLVFIVEKFGSLFQLHLTVNGCTSGPLLGIYIIGLFIPWINSKCTLLGGIFGSIVAAWIAVKGQMAVLNKEIIFEQKPTATYGCTYSYKTVMSQPIIEMEPVAPQIYHVSYMLYPFIGLVVTLIVAGMSSLIFGRQDPNNVNPILLAPCIRKYFRNVDQVVVKSTKCQMDDTNSITETTHEFHPFSSK